MSSQVRRDAATDPSPLPLPDWPARLRAQGRSMVWLAEQVGASRTYLADVAAGRKRASAGLVERIRLVLSPEMEDQRAVIRADLLDIATGGEDRLAAVREYADERARWRDVEQKALALVAAIHVALGDVPE